MNTFDALDTVKPYKIWDGGDETRELHAGETYVIPSDTPHGGAAGPEGASVVDVFNPARADWEKLERLEPSAGNWP